MSSTKLFFIVLTMFFLFGPISSAQKIQTWNYFVAEGGVNSPYKIDGLIGDQTIPSWHPYLRIGGGSRVFDGPRSLFGFGGDFGFVYSRFAHDGKDTGTSYAAKMAGIDFKFGLIFGIPELHLELNSTLFANTIWDKTYPASHRIDSEHRKDDSTKFNVGIGIGMAINSIISDNFGFGVEGSYRYSNGFILANKDIYTQAHGQFFIGIKLMFGRVTGYVDSDGDGIDDKSEITIYKTDPEKADTDGDRVSDYDEIFKYKTDPLKADTDGDGVSDGDELYTFGTNPLSADTDGDGLSDGDEILQYKTNPLKTDTDGDGLSDYDEIFKYKSDPLKADTDGDGLSDFDEVSKYKTNPALADTDGDGITDRDEIKKFNTDPFKADTDEDGINDRDEIVVYHTNALIADSDGDGIKDYDEIFVYKTKPLVFDTDIDQISDGDEVFKYHTNPALGDSDNDGLGDYQEIFYYYTNPLLIDSDNSGVDDKAEVERGTDPNDKEDDVIEVNKIIVLEGIEFEFQKATITPESDRRLQKTLKLLQAFPSYNFSLEGHTDDVGGRQFNQKLSLDRAKAVKTWLVDHGINTKRLNVKGFGFDKPVATNSTDEGRQRNRRVEFIRTN
ncbi:MAG: OmpA family protein [Ignavibacteria bacterium]|nr:OmpA family protein [Ignavibacteria bacterium]